MSQTSARPARGGQRRRLLAVATGLSAAALSLTPGSPAAAQATTLECGATITEDTVLGNDLVDCPGNGIVIGAPGITLDLNRHTLSGPGPFGSFAGGTGVLNEGFENVTIRNGTVTNFVEGVAVFDTSGNTVTRITARGNVFGVSLTRTSTSRIEGVLATGNDAPGIVVGPGDDSLVRFNVASRNDGFGIQVGFGATGRVERNIADGNGQDGIFVQNASGTTLTRNSAKSNTELGIEVINGAIDGGGNIARNNGDPRQCVGVTCARGILLLFDGEA